uniref:Calcium-activated potassium channel BK alpha subunit domain-containing protein n=1 Tax=Athene cunicularia TaxID=194338 RepID=A0A663MIT8_ATHCN
MLARTEHVNPKLYLYYRVLSIKNHYPNTRVILQIIQSHNKAYLPNIPSWGRRTGDSIICLAELKLGFIAQSCLVPGLSTLLTNLFIVEEDTEVHPSLHRDAVTNCNLFCFPRLCFVKLNLVLLGIELRFGSQGESTILINPSAQIKLHRNTMGFFIAHSLEACLDLCHPENIKL